jgi:hypothetical protein
MTQKEIRDQVENLIRMSRISNTVAPQEFKAVDLVPIMTPYFNAAAQNVLQNQKCNSTLVQWNRQVSNSKYEGPQAYALGEFLGKLKIKSNEDLFQSNYVREVSQVKYYGHCTTPDRLADAALVMVGMINDLATKGLIRAVLAPLMSIELVGGKVVVVSYIAIDQPNEALVQSMYGSLSFQEGGIPPEFK